MAAPIAAIIGGVASLAGGLLGKSGKKGVPGGASLVDPRQAAMANLMQRERQTLKMGTGDTFARAEAQKDVKNLLKNRARLGGRGPTADIMKYRRSVEEGIKKGVADERLGIMQHLAPLESDISKRKMDLVELPKERALLKKEANEQNLKKNVTALAGRAFATSGGGEGGQGSGNNIGNAITSLFNQGGGGGQGDKGGGVNWGKVASVIGGFFNQGGSK